MQSRYVSLASNGNTGVSSAPGSAAVSAWQIVDTSRPSPVNLGFSIISSSAATLASSGAAFIQVTMDDPTGTYPNPLSLSSAPFVTAFPSSGIVAFGSVLGTSQATYPQCFGITIPVAAWRLVNGSSAGTAIVSFVQSA